MLACYMLIHIHANRGSFVPLNNKVSYKSQGVTVHVL